MKTYRHIDVVIPNAGVSELGSFTAVRSQVVNGEPTKPSLKTLEVNLFGVLYSKIATHLDDPIILIT